MTGVEHLKHGTPEPRIKGGYGTFADLEESMCRGDPKGEDFFIVPIQRFKENI